MNNSKEKQLNLYNFVWYFTIFSIVGLIIETIYCFATTGILESRKGLIFGPFCPVYGIGATLMIFILNRYSNNYFKLFFYGFLLGSIIEYLLSYALEAIYGIRFWEYSYINSNLNGRICIPYSSFWGILSIMLVKFIKPMIDKLLSKIPKNINKKCIIFILVFFIFDCICTVWAISSCKNRILYSRDLDIIEKSTLQKQVNKLESILFPTEYVIKNFPNLRIIDNGEEKFIRNLIT